MREGGEREREEGEGGLTGGIHLEFVGTKNLHSNGQSDLFSGETADLCDESSSLFLEVCSELGCHFANMKHPRGGARFAMNRPH
jgi:hypothetical protein